MPSYRLLLDEHVEHEVLDRPRDRGHDVVHVEGVPALGKGASDTALGAYSIESDRTIVTYDDDFVSSVATQSYHATLFFEDETLSAAEVAEIIHAMSELYPHDRVRGLQKAGRGWL